MIFVFVLSQNGIMLQGASMNKFLMFLMLFLAVFAINLYADYDDLENPNKPSDTLNP